MTGEVLNTDKVIEIQGLTKQFKNLTAVNNLDLTVYKGDVFGFLGPNGAGESTTIRMLLSLIKPTSGKIRLFGKSIKEHRREILSKVGAIVEKPDFYLYLTAYKNLEILGKLSGIKTSRKIIMEMLGIVGLDKRYNSKVKTFSHGMKQRLGLAQALIHDPDLIVLDEPTTGLDPQGMKEIRDLIIHLSKDRGKTIFLSSHILSEVEIVANRMIILNKGIKRVEGYVQELLNAGQLKVTFKTKDNPKAVDLISNSRWNDKIVSAVNSDIILNLQQEEITGLNKYLVENNIDIFSIIPARSLEEYFLTITEGKE
jgi:ABC-type multidrug transport system ATPase subunit